MAPKTFRQRLSCRASWRGVGVPVAVPGDKPCASDAAAATDTSAGVATRRVSKKSRGRQQRAVYEQTSESEVSQARWTE